jgi:hypothetical protein
MPRARHEDRVEIVFFDQAIEMDVGKALPRIGTPVTEQAGLRMLQLERFMQKGIVLEVEHPQREVQTRAPVGVGLAQFVGRERRSADR